MIPLTLSPKLLRACALGHSHEMSRHVALQMWALSGNKTVLQDLKLIAEDESLPSSFRHSAIRLMAETHSAEAVPYLFRRLRDEQHPRLIGTMLNLIRDHGPAQAYSTLEQMAMSRAWPGSCRLPLQSALRLLRHRWAIQAEGSMSERVLPAEESNWQYAPLRLKAASGPDFQQASKVVRKIFPGIRFTDSFAATFPYHGREMVLLITPQLNEFASHEDLTSAPAVLGLILRKEEDQFFPFAWALSQPGAHHQIRVELRHMDGRALMTGKAEQHEDVLHLQLTTARGAKAPVRSLGLAFRKNQILRDSYLKQPLQADECAETLSFSISA